MKASSSVQHKCLANQPVASVEWKMGSVGRDRSPWQSPGAAEKAATGPVRDPLIDRGEARGKKAHGEIG
eukprot:gene8151-8344_t